MRFPASWLILSLFLSGLAWPETVPLTGYVIHFDFINDAQEARALVRVAQSAGARVINVVPPAHVWERPDALKILDDLLQEIQRRHLQFVFTRIDASYPADPSGERYDYLYGHILENLGRMPSGKLTPAYFLTTIGLDDYAIWMEEETRFYARRYGRLPNLIGINLGPFSEPFVSQRGGFLEYEEQTNRYEITQYTQSAERFWHRWLHDHIGNLEAVNAAYQARFQDFNGIPLPLNEADKRFGRPARAYYDFVRTINDWFVDRYEACRRIWHEESHRNDVPFILQLSGFGAEKFALGRPAYVALDLPDWIARADAVGLSIYTNGGYDDFGHASIRATVRLLGLARDLGKPVFVLEGGCENPESVLNLSELRFYASVGQALAPRTYIYEFLKDAFDRPSMANSGRMVSRDGRIRRPVFNVLKNLMKDIRGGTEVKETPLLYVLDLPEAARDDPKIGEVEMALYDLASVIPIRWVPPAALPLVPAGSLLWRPDTGVKSLKLSALLSRIPPVGTQARLSWREAVKGVLEKRKAGSAASSKKIQ